MYYLICKKRNTNTHIRSPHCYNLTVLLLLLIAVLDRIGKGLDPRFDISEIAKP